MAYLWYDTYVITGCEFLEPGIYSSVCVLYVHYLTSFTVLSINSILWEIIAGHVTYSQ